MTPRTARWLAVLGGLLGLLAALLLFAPARWLGAALDSATGGQLQLANERGSVWRGQADLLFTGGDGSQSLSALPQGLRWTLAPTFTGYAPAVALSLTTPCCSPEPMRLIWTPRWQTLDLRVERFNSQWPAVLLVGLGTPWNTLRPEGQLVFRSDGLQVQTVDGRLRLRGALDLDALDMSSRLSPLRPLGSYRVKWQATPDGSSASLVLNTLRGGLQLSGQGQWIGGRLRFNGSAEAAPGSETALDNLLNILGRRQGPRSVLQIG